MKTVINEQGCTTHPYGEPSVEVTVPLLLNGSNVTDQLTQLTVANLNFSMKVEELERLVQSLQTAVKELGERPTVTATVTETEEPVVAVKSGKKPPTKSISTTATETTSTAVV